MSKRVLAESSEARVPKALSHLRTASASLLLGGLIWPTIAPAQDLYASIYSALGSQKTEGQVVVLVDTAIQVPTWAVMADAVAAARFASSLDRSISAGWITRFKDSTRVSTEYSRIPVDSKWGRRAFTKLEEDDYGRTRDTLFQRVSPQSEKYERTEGYQRYLDLQTAYNEIKRTYDLTPPDQRTAAMRAKLAEARSRLTGEGQQTLFREAESRLRQLLAYDFSKSILARLQTSVASMSDAAGQVKVAPTPQITARMNLLGWRDISLPWPTDKLPGIPSDPKLPEIRGSLVASFPNGEIAEVPLPTNLKISGELARVQIARPWLDVDLLRRSDGIWQWIDQSKPKLSDGPGATAASTAPLSFIPSELYIMRNISFDGLWTVDAERLLAKAILTGATIKFGPIVVSSPEPGGIGRPSFRTATSLFVQDAQVVALSATSLPVLPGAPSADIIFDKPLPTFPFP